jgi:CBS domain-containing protein
VGAEVIAMHSTVGDVMTTRVVAVREDAPFKDMVATLRESRISAFPVIDHDGKVIGVVSEADLLTKQADLATHPGPFGTRNHAKAAGVTAGELMTSPPITVGPGATVAEAARLMRNHRVKRLPVVSRTGHLIGIVSRADVLSIYTRPDAAIRHEVLEEVIVEGFLTGSQDYDARVHHGIVTLSGHPETGRAGHDLVEAIRHIDGVVAVRDRLSYAGTPR